ncbi:hypothetical protein ACWC0A_33075 [Streptomyces scopuliridis]
MAHEDRHVVLDGDAVAEDVPVAVVAVFPLGVQVQGAQTLVVLHVQGEEVVRRRG